MAKDAMEEIQTLENLQRIARCDTLDNLIADGLSQKQEQKKALAGTSAHLRKLRKRKANVMLALAGMTPQRLKDMQEAFTAKENRRAAAKKARTSNGKVLQKNGDDDSTKATAPSSGSRESHPKASPVADAPAGTDEEEEAIR